MITPSPKHAFAVLDLGSNSFHLLVARQLQHGWVSDERMKRKVQLLSGFADGRLSEAAIHRGLECIGVFAQRIAAVDRSAVRVMGTFALRRAENRDAFVARASELLGVPVQVISGDEEARLIFLGVAGALPQHDGNRCVVDIGGGSTEIVLGTAGTEGAAAATAVSLSLGCVALTDRFFSGPMAPASAYRHARQAAVELLRDSVLPSVAPGVELVGTSGTIESILTVLDANGWGDGDITAEGLGRIEAALNEHAWFADAGVPGLPLDRVDIFPAGLAILSAVFEVLKLQRMRYVNASMQDGMLEALVAETRRAAPADPPPGEPTPSMPRELTIAQLQLRFEIDRAQAARVAATALELFEAVSGPWMLDDECRRLLGWAAALHEIGKLLGPQHYHRHGAYVLKSCELRGFAHEERARLALLVRGHRRSFPGLAFRAFSPDAAEKLRRLIVLLRISVILHRSRRDEPVPTTVFAVGNTLTLRVAPDWLDAHPLSHSELLVEVAQVAGVGLTLVLAEH